MIASSQSYSLPNSYGITGILEGRIVDKQAGSPLVGVNIVILGQPQGGTTDAEGYYQIKNIRAGVYDVRYSIVGYKTVVMKGVTILPDLRTRMDIQMDVTTIELDVIEVRAEQPLIQKDLAATAYSIGDIKLNKLPISAFQEVLSLQPGTTVEGNVRGGKTTEVVFLVDGLPVQDVVGGGIGTSLPRSSISGLTIHTGGFDAEYGNALSGVVNVVTKTGGDKQSYSLRYEKDNWLPESVNKQTDRATEIELSAGGPIVSQKLSYFTANTIISHDTRWWQDFSKTFVSPISQEFTGFSKLEYQISQAVRLGFQGIYSLRSWRDYEFSWRFNLGGLPERKRDSYRLAAVLSHTLSENSFYTVSLSRYFLNTHIGGDSKEGLSLQPYEYDFFLRYITGGTRNWWADTKQIIYTMKGDYTTQIDKMHMFKIGFEVNQFDIFSDLVKYEPQTTYFGKPIVDAPLLNYSNSYTYKPRSGSVFIQDKVELVKDGSNFSVGVRWDFLDPTAERPLVEFIPISQTEFEQQVTGFARAKIKHQISPRLSLAGPIGTSSFFFVNFGHYFQYPLFDYLYSGINPAQLRIGSKNVLAGNPDLEPERTVSWELGFKHGIIQNVVASATYFRKKTSNQIDSKTLIPADSKSAGDYGFASYVNNAEATSTGIELLISREHDEKLSGSISYSYMVTEGISESVDQRINFEQWGFPLAVTPFPLSWDQRHTIKADAEFTLPFDIRSNVIVLYNSPRPYTYFPTRDGFTPLDPTKLLVPNNRRMEDVIFFNVKLTRRFVFDEQQRYVLTVFADIRNTINKKNVRWYDSSGRVGGELGDPGAFYDPRRVRVGVRLEL
ncbi:MAG TPA: TonB-dependent receptor [Bacteroidota bacterium]